MSGPANLHIQQRPSPNHGPRRGGLVPDILLLHYTGMDNAEAALGWLCEPDSKVSCHYLVDELGGVFQLVPEDLRAWHAGVSSWCGETDINSRSIGVEIHNPGHERGYPDFPDDQMTAVEALCHDILGRHDIPARRVLAHSDVAPGRKTDPGEKFDWARLARAGIGHWVEPLPPTDDEGLRCGSEGAVVLQLQSGLADYGYGIEPSGRYDEATEEVVCAFQSHFRQARVDGIADRSTRQTLERLLGKML